MSICIAPLLYGFITRPQSPFSLPFGDEIGYDCFVERAINSCPTEDAQPLSPYDDLFKEICSKYGHNWLLLSAIAHVESRYNHEAVSRAGARGLMQIMPSTAAIYGVDKEELIDPRTSIVLANRYLLEIERMLMLPDSIDERDKLSLTLAAYNGGIGRIYDAQRLARRAGSDPYDWSALKWHLWSLKKEEIHTLPEVRYGRFIGSGATLAYVHNVTEVYNGYLAAIANSPYHLLPAAR